MLQKWNQCGCPNSDNLIKLCDLVCPQHMLQCTQLACYHCCHFRLFCLDRSLSFLIVISDFFGSILCCSQSGDDPHEELAKFGYME
jgi:hypothetical protein